jgi:hypothetical protein
MIRRFCGYLEKVFQWSGQLARLRDSRTKPQIPAAAVFMSALLMFVMRLGSLNALEAQHRGGWRWGALVGRRRISADSMGRIVARLASAGLRALLCHVGHRLRRNKVLEDNPWALRFAVFDGHEFFRLAPPLLRPVLPSSGDGRGPQGHRVLPSRRGGPADRI